MALLLAGCLPWPGDGILQVTGKVTDIKGRPFDKCGFELFYPSGGLLHQEEIAGEFSIRVIGPPGRNEYVAEISCLGARTSFRSAPVEIGGEPPTNLGRITLERE